MRSERYSSTESSSSQNSAERQEEISFEISQACFAQADRRKRCKSTAQGIVFRASDIIPAEGWSNMQPGQRRKTGSSHKPTE